MPSCKECCQNPPNSVVQEEVPPLELLTISNPTEEQREPLDGSSINSAEFQVFHNPLLMDKISKYLEHTDFKSLGETGKLLLTPSRSCSQFIRNTQLVIDEKCSAKNLDVLKYDFIPWNTVNINVRRYDPHVYEIIKQVLQTPSIKTIQLDQTDSDEQSFYLSDDDLAEPSEDYCFNEVGIQSLTECFAILLVSIQNLKCLKLSLDLMSNIDNLFDSPNLELLSSKLDTLEIYVPNPRSNSRRKIQRDLLVEGGTRSRAFTHSIESLAALMSGKRLRSFSFQLKTMNRFSGIALRLEPAEDTEELISYIKAIAKLVTQHQESLEELSLHGQVWSCSELGAVHCPKLKSLDVETKSSNCTNLAGFIENQPLLGSLSLRIRQEIMKSSNLLDVIRRKSSKLEKLHICWTLARDREFRKKFDWTFLQGMTRLTDLSIHQHQVKQTRFFRRGPVPSLVSHLPPSLKKLQILSEPQAVRIPDPESFRVTSSLAKFRCLTHLDMSYASNSITDAGLQFICSNMQQLLVLRINSCATLTNFGITGKWENKVDTGISLASLTRLRELVVVNYNKLSFPTLLTVVQFKDLQRLHICVPMSLRDLQIPLFEHILSIATQNPCLEELRLWRHFDKGAKMSPSDSMESIKAAVEKLRPRLIKDLQIYEVFR